MKRPEALAIADQLEFEAGVVFDDHRTAIVSIVVARLAARCLLAMKKEHRVEARDAFVSLMDGELRQMEIGETLKEMWQ